MRPSESTPSAANDRAVLPRIRLDRINVRLAGRPVIHDVSWTLNPGEHWAFVGPNGSGKSTLLRVIAGTQWIEADDGRRSYSPDGIRSDVVARAATWIRLVSAELHEHYARLDLALSARDVIASGLTGSTYIHAPPSPRDAHCIAALLDDLDMVAIAERPIRRLSTGQLRRVLIARALVAEPRVIVLDEFTNGLDRSARRDVLDLLDRIAPRASLVAASHRSDDFPAAVTHTAAVANGRIGSAGPGRPTRGGRPIVAIHAGDTGVANGDVLLRFRGADVYRGRTHVLRNVDWELRRGEHTLIRGANGAGKTTFAGLIAGTQSAATGAYIERFGELGPFDVWKLKERVAHVSDDLQIAYDRHETVDAVIASGFPASIGLFVEATAEQRSAVARVASRIGIESLRGRTFTALSFGERRKVLIARSLVRRPEILVLDEIWNGLDVQFRQHLADLLSEMAAAGTTIVAIAHQDDGEIAVLGRRVCVVVDGSIRDVAVTADR